MCSSGDEEEDDAGGPGDSMFFFEAFSNAQLANKSRRGITGTLRSRLIICTFVELPRKRKLSGGT